MLLYRLGQYTFHGMWGGPQFNQTVIAGETRPGVDGTSLHDLGSWGEPFDIQTITFTPTYAAAIELCKTYSTASSENAYVMTIGSVGVTGGRYKVLKAEPKPKAVIVRAPAALVGYLGEVRTTWTLLPLADIQQ
jgi:hypothetical protein